MARLGAVGKLQHWLEKGGIAGANGKSGGALHFLLDPAVEVFGGDENVGLRAKGNVEPGTLLLGVATACALHPLNEAISSARKEQVRAGAAVLRQAMGEGSFRSPLLNPKNEGWIETVVLLALELADSASPWRPYLETLPSPACTALPSLWPFLFEEGGEGEAAVDILSGTTMGGMVSADVEDLRAVLTEDLAHAALSGLTATPSVARRTLIHAIGAVNSRVIGGVGLVPFVDLVNGCPQGLHNCTFERTQLAKSAKSKATPCLALVSSRAITRLVKRDSVASYGSYSSGEFLYRYNWLVGGLTPPPAASAASAAASMAHETVGLPVRPIWKSLSETQQQVLTKNGLPLTELLADGQPDGPLSLLVSDASQGKWTGELQSLALIACCKDEATLQNMLKTGSAGGKGITRSDLALAVATWCRAQVWELSQPTSQTDDKKDAASFCKGLAHRLRSEERGRVVKWIAGLQQTHALPKELWSSTLRCHLAACKGDPLPPLVDE